MNKKTYEQKNLRTKEQNNKLFLSFYVIKFLSFLVLMFLSFLVFGFALSARAEDFNANNLVSDGAFVNINSMNKDDIQSFLTNKGSFLANYSEGGRSAAQIIYDAAHGYGEASGSANGIDINTSTGTISPQVILVTLQKEQSLITMTSQNDDALRKAMGYGCPDSGGCNAAYAGFTNQVEWASWQLRYNYERSQGHGFSDYQVGQTMNFNNSGGRPNADVTFHNRATASLYRYTPHTYNGNYNFWYYFYQWFIVRDMDGKWDGQSGLVYGKPGQVINMWVRFKNVGSYAWSASGANPVRLAVDKTQDENLIKRFNNNWVAEYRIANMTPASVAPGEVATFNFTIKIPDNINPGEYRFDARMISENFKWFIDPDTNGAAWWRIIVPKPTAELVSQSSYDIKAWPGEVVSASISFKNTQGVAWTNWGPASTKLAVDKRENENFINSFKHSSWLGDYRIANLSQSSVDNNGTANFDFKIQIPEGLLPGVYRFNVRLVQDGFAWFENPDINGAGWWQITVPSPSASWQGQSENPTLNRGDIQTMWVKFRNDTSKTWRTTDPRTVRLALDKKWASKTAWQGSGWISENRITGALEGDVPPGGIGTYRFNISVPNDMPSGKHKFYVRLVAENFYWFEDPDINGACWWEITVR